VLRKSHKRAEWNSRLDRISGDQNFENSNSALIKLDEQKLIGEEPHPHRSASLIIDTKSVALGRTLFAHGALDHIWQLAKIAHGEPGADIASNQIQLGIGRVGGSPNASVKAASAEAMPARHLTTTEVDCSHRMLDLRRAIPQ
jgi:hypothetical protein